MSRRANEPTADHWPSRISDVIYAPSVPLGERTDLPRSYKAGLRYREKWGDRVFLFVDLRVVYENDPKKLMDEVSAACFQVWTTARPLGGLLDLGEISARLEQERWACCQLIRQLSSLIGEPFRTEAAEKVLVSQITERLAELKGWAEENHRLYEEHGADPASVSRSVAGALTTAEALAGERPSRDTTEYIGELRRLLRGHADSEV